MVETLNGDIDGMLEVEFGQELKKVMEPNNGGLQHIGTLPQGPHKFLRMKTQERHPLGFGVRSRIKGRWGEVGCSVVITEKYAQFSQ